MVPNRATHHICRGNRSFNTWHEVPKVESAEEEQPDLFDSASEEEEDLLQTLANNVASLEEGPLFFFVVRLLRFGWSIKINSRFLSWLCYHCDLSHYRVETKHVSKKSKLFKGSFKKYVRGAGGGLVVKKRTKTNRGKRGLSLSVRSLCEKNCLIFKQQAEFFLLSCLAVAKCFLFWA